MKLHLTVLALFIAGIFTACAQGKKASKTNPNSTKISGPDISGLTMNRTGCFGKCPEYSISIKRDGSATYVGGRNAAHQGTYTKNIGRETAENLLNQFREHRVDTCAAIYRVRISDLPGIHFAFTINGIEKKVTNAHAGPSYFEGLALEVDRVATPDASWEKIKESPKQ